MASEKKIGKMQKLLNDKFAKARLESHDDEVDIKIITLNMENHRTIKVVMYIPKDPMKEKYYACVFLGYLDDMHHTLYSVARFLLTIGEMNKDISSLPPRDLEELGFVPEEGTNLYAVYNMLVKDNYKLQLTNQVAYSDPEKKWDEKTKYYQENLTIFGKTVAKRLVSGYKELEKAYIQIDSEITKYNEAHQEEIQALMDKGEWK